MLKKGQPFLWMPAARKGLRRIIETSVNNLQMNQPDPEKPFEMEIDASKYATGAVLIQ
jgi:hypothetical protein